MEFHCETWSWEVLTYSIKVERQIQPINYRAPSFFSPFLPNYEFDRYYFRSFTFNATSENQLGDYHHSVKNSSIADTDRSRRTSSDTDCI